jgi:hypothetical protein
MKNFNKKMFMLLALSTLIGSGSTFARCKDHNDAASCVKDTKAGKGAQACFWNEKAKPPCSSRPAPAAKPNQPAPIAPAPRPSPSSGQGPGSEGTHGTPKPGHEGTRF